jgi:general secretion pathway protein F
MQFEVRTLSPDMVIGQQVVDGRDEADVRRQMEARGLFVSAIHPLRGRRRARGKSLSLVLFSQELLALLSAGLGVVEALEALLEKEAARATPSWRCWAP